MEPRKAETETGPNPLASPDGGNVRDGVRPVSNPLASPDGGIVYDNI